FCGERWVDLSRAGVPEVEGDLPQCDEVVQLRDVDVPVCLVAGQQRVPEDRVVRTVAQLPQRDGDLVQPRTGAAVVEVNQLDIAVLEPRVAEVEVSMDE